jgi:hypothetical protein
MTDLGLEGAQLLAAPRQRKMRGQCSFEFVMNSHIASSISRKVAEVFVLSAFVV